MSNMNLTHILDSGEGIVVTVTVEVDDQTAIALYQNHAGWTAHSAVVARDLTNYLIDGKDGAL